MVLIASLYGFQIQHNNKIVENMSVVNILANRINFFILNFLPIIF